MKHTYVHALAINHIQLAIRYDVYSKSYLVIGNSSIVEFARCGMPGMRGMHMRDMYPCLSKTP